MSAIAGWILLVAAEAAFRRAVALAFDWSDAYRIPYRAAHGLRDAAAEYGVRL